MEQNKEIICKTANIDSLTNKNIPFHEFTKGKAIPFLSTVLKKTYFMKHYDNVNGHPTHVMKSRDGLVISIPVTYLGKNNDLHEFSAHHQSMGYLSEGIRCFGKGKFVKKIRFLVNPNKDDMCILQAADVEINPNIRQPTPGTYGLLLTKQLIISRIEPKSQTLQLEFGSCYFVHGEEQNDYTIIKEEVVSPQLADQLTKNLEMDMDYQWYADFKKIVKRIRGLQKDVETCTKTIDATLNNCPEDDARTLILFHLRKKRDEVDAAALKLQKHYFRCEARWQKEREHYENLNNRQALQKMHEIEARFENECKDKPRKYI